MKSWNPLGKLDMSRDLGGSDVGFEIPGLGNWNPDDMLSRSAQGCALTAAR